VILLRRIYDAPDAGDGDRVLVDRLWPRGMRKADASIDVWCKDVAPSTVLRRWYGHDPARFDDFAARYRAELEPPPAEAVAAGLARRGRRSTVTLLTATRDLERSGAAVLRDHLRR
jgi:uncharacterized protein YeaO (DUF488 family)